MKKSTLKTIGNIALSLAPFACCASLSVGLVIYFGVKSVGILDDFKNSEMFQEVKEEELSQMSKLEATYIEAQKNFDSGKISVKELNTAKKQFNAQKDYVESNTLVFDYMPQDIRQRYDDLQQGASIACFAMPIASFGGFMLAYPISKHLEKKEKELTE